MDEVYRAQLRLRFGFDDWASPPVKIATASAEGLVAVGAELGGWRAAKVDPLLMPGATAASVSFWSGGDDVLLRLDLFETASASASRELLLELLGEFQSPQIEREADATAGDLAFVVPGGTALLFTRSELVSMIRNAGRRVVPVGEFGRLVDELLTGDRGATPG